MACKIHGVWDGKAFHPSAGPRTENHGDDRAFDDERRAFESRVEPVDRIALGGPVSAAALGLDEAATEVTLRELAILAASPSARVRSVVATALRRMRNPVGVPVLRTLLADPDEYVRKQSAWALGQIGSAADVPYLSRLWRDPAERVRDFAAYALARLGDPAGIEHTLEVLADRSRNPIRRGEAAVALGDGARRSWPRVYGGGPDALRDPARAAIERVQGEQPPPELAARCAYALERLN